MWNFSTISRQETRANSKLSNFFESDKGNAGDAESLIRESLQNALDAKINPADSSPVLVKITIGQQVKSSVSWMFESFDEHVDIVQHEANREYPADIPENFSYVLIEDFNTSGFDGTFNNEDEQGKGTLVKFWWEEGISEKLKGGGGSHGVGKVTLSEASKSRVFFAHSIRAEDSDEILFGYCRLGLHALDGRKYREYARFGSIGVAENAADDQLTPYSRLKGGQASISAIERFTKAFNISRSTPGASILVPNVELSEFTSERLGEVILDNFYLPILKGLLIVEIMDMRTHSLERIDANTIEEYGTAHKASDKRFVEKFRLAQSLNEDMGFFTLSPEFEFSGDSKRVSKESFAEVRLMEMKKEYESGNPVKVLVSIPLYPIDSEMERGYLKIALQRRVDSPDEKGFYEVFRGNVRIMDEKCNNRKANAILEISGELSDGSRNPLSEFMKYCEDPGHRNWNASVNRKNEKVRYEKTQVWQRILVKESVSDLLKILESEVDKKIEDFGDDIFFYKTIAETELANEKEIEDGISGDESNNGSVPSPPPPDVPQSRPVVSISKISGGVRIGPTKHFQLPFGGLNAAASFDVEFCYEMFGLSKAAWKKHSKFEMDLNDRLLYPIAVEGVDVTEISANQVKFRPTKKDFNFEISGFDINRQLYVSISHIDNLDQSAGGQI